MIEFFSDFINPEKRLFIGYLASAGVMALVYLRWVQQQPLMHSIRGFFSRQIWLSKSALADYQLMLFNHLLIRLIPGLTLIQGAMTLQVFESLHWLQVRPDMGIIPTWIVISSFTLVLFILDDFSRFYLHRLLHRIPWLWRFHKAHHSATNLTPLTVLRTHPVEALLFSFRGFIVHALSIGIFFFYFGEQVALYQFFGASIFVFLFHLLGSNLRHSHVYLGYWLGLEKWLISPAQHQIHHSKESVHFDCNFGAVLAIWDRLGKTLILSKTTQQPEVGLGRTPEKPHHLKTLLLGHD